MASQKCVVPIFRKVTGPIKTDLYNGTCLEPLLVAFGNSIFMKFVNCMYEVHVTFSSCHFGQEVE